MAGPKPELIALRIHLLDLQHQPVTGLAAGRALSGKIHGQRINANQSESILRSQPAQEINRPKFLLVPFEPHLLPVALIFA